MLEEAGDQAAVDSPVGLVSDVFMIKVKPRPDVIEAAEADMKQAFRYANYLRYERVSS
jgi:hypothetical protein